MAFGVLKTSLCFVREHITISSVGLLKFDYLANGVVVKREGISISIEK